jgi:hypothetical protein
MQYKKLSNNYATKQSMANKSSVWQRRVVWRHGLPFSAFMSGYIVFIIFNQPINYQVKFFWFVANVWHMSSGGFRSDSLSTEAETKIGVLRLATHKPRHYLYAVLAPVVIFYFYISPNH